ncbi:MAG: proline dehydrogenase family protein [Phycisphaerae bacterium]|nr:proline dehydrogenase family protein [Phycisphaerae bacterium]
MTLARLSPAAIEPEIGRIGREIFKRAEDASPSIFSMEAWQQFGMNWLTSDEDLKLRLFRFIEVMPSLNDATSIARHLIDYLEPKAAWRRVKGHRLPGILELAIGFDRPESAYAHFVAWAARFGCGTSARQFIVGSTPGEAVAAVRKLRRKGMTFTLDVLGETIIADRVARHHQELYLELIRHLGRESLEWREDPILDRTPWGSLPKVNVSIKLSAIVVRFDPIDPEGVAAAVLDRLRPIFRAARQVGAFINIDMEHYAVKDMTLEIFKRVLSEPEFRDWPDVGIVIQTYMPEGETDLRELIGWVRRRGTPISVRIVKGAYWDSETATAVRNKWPIPLYTEKWRSDESFERVSALLLKNADVVRPAFASHNVRSIAAVLAMEATLGLPERTLELQMLTGMGDPLKRALVSMRQRLRIYAPFGDLMTGMAYLIRRLIENTANESFLRQSFGQHMSVDALLARPGSQPPTCPTILPAPRIQDPEGEECMEPFNESAEMDFSRDANREAMKAAIASTRAQFGRKYPAIIANGGVDTREWHESLNPSNRNEIVGRTAICDHALADRAISAARAAFPKWSATPPAERASLLDRAADLLESRRFEICAWMIHEVGKTWREAQADFMETADYFRFYAREMRRLSARPRRRDFPGESNEYNYLPRGVVLTIGPYCFPTSLIGGMTAAAIVTGNTVVMKPANDAAVCAARLCEILIEAGLPPGVLNFTPGPGADLGEFLVRHPGIDMIAFTGSSAVGRGLIDQARSASTDRGATKHIIAEMGGKNAIIVDDDADLDDAVQAVMASAFGYAGQKCTACSRVIVVGSIYEAFVEKLVDSASAIKPGPADSPATSVGPLINEQALSVAERFIENGMREARCVLPPKKGAGEAGFFMSPVIFSDVPCDAFIAREECMAPVLCIHRAKSFEEAVEIANCTNYALCAGLYSRSPRHCEFAKLRLRAGMIYVNRKITLSRVDRQPFGGFDQSGLGSKTGGPDYLQQFMLPRTISENTARHGFTPATDAHRETASAHA